MSASMTSLHTKVSLKVPNYQTNIWSTYGHFSQKFLYTFFLTCQQTISTDDWTVKCFSFQTYFGHKLASLTSYDGCCNEKNHFKIELWVRLSICDSMLVTLYKICEVHFRLLGTSGFHVKVKNERSTAAGLHCRQNLKYQSFTSSFGRQTGYSGVNSNGTLHSGEFFFGKNVIPSEVLLFHRFNRNFQKFPCHLSITRCQAPRGNVSEKKCKISRNLGSNGTAQSDPFPWRGIVQFLSSKKFQGKFHSNGKRSKSKTCNKKRAASAAWLLFLIRSIMSLICGVVAAFS